MSKFKVSFKLVDLEDKTKSKMVRGEVEIKESPAFQYGNRKCMSIWFKEGIESYDTYDIRYDTNYNPDDEVGYIEQVMRGDFNGYYTKIQYLRVTPVFSLKD